MRAAVPHQRFERRNHVSDEIHISPAEGQSAAEAAEVVTKAAETRGLDTDGIEVAGDEVIVPLDVAVELLPKLRSSSPVKAFPPVNQTYMLQEPVQFYKPGTTAAEGEPIGVLEGFGVVVNQSA
jgi:hypothetical protein